MMEAKLILVPVCLFVAVCISGVTTHCVDEKYDYNCDFLDKEEYGVCCIRGDPHITTWDGCRYRFTGDCSYTLVDFCENQNPLQINAIFRERAKNSSQTYASAVSVVIDGKTYTLSEDGVFIDTVLQEEDDLPYAKDGNNVEIFQGNDHICVLRVCDQNEELIFRVGYNKKYHIIKIFASRDDFFEQLCGMCGFYNDKDTDDFKTSKNKVKSTTRSRGRRRRMTTDSESKTEGGGGGGGGGATESSNKKKSSKMGKTVQDFGERWKIDGSCSK
ncbi:IgGFc-binding protein [Holothuria leucospilota]|uniref:IgGFc-binding protein n=1 Tax=Holothuria leucospilota TaxID=206669 RepID=A0A9Q1BQS3_HOLLE|nr:IgGFc-binding protein [Holothuria leucospilota]